ncbi:MAG TPA: hypothetical protein VH951_02430 [Dehalococcoidia bacterium]|jgi:hypothetical protein
MPVRRLLPLRLRRSVGAWGFVDHYEPMSVDGLFGEVGGYAGAPLAVPPLDIRLLSRRSASGCPAGR